MVKILNLSQEKVSSLSLHFRDCAVDMTFTNRVLTVSCKDAGELRGVVTFEAAELPHLEGMVCAYFAEGLRGGGFVPGTPAQMSPELPMLRIEPANWGEPFRQGVSFVFSENFEDYTLDNVSFDLEASDLRQFRIFLAGLIP